jgi:hypothetical protein
MALTDVQAHKPVILSRELRLDADIPLLEPVWARLDQLAQDVNQIILAEAVGESDEAHDIGEGKGGMELDSSPPRYSMDSYADSGNSLPSYSEHVVHPAIQKAHSSQSDATSRATDKKILYELDDVTSAIERLQQVEPRMHDQRVEMKPVAGPSGLRNDDAIARMERDKMRELEAIWEKIERAHARRGVKERVNLEDHEERRLIRVCVSSGGVA